MPCALGPDEFDPQSWKDTNIFMAEEIIPGLYRIAIMHPRSSPKRVNVYAVLGPAGVRLIDCAWNTAEAYEALVNELHEIGVQVGDIREILVTHNHTDHIGLTERLVQESGARLLMHRLDARYLRFSREELESRRAAWLAWLRSGGMPADELEAIINQGRRMSMQMPTFWPDVLLEGGEQLDWSPFHFEVIWTPGHSAGLVCLYEPQRALLITSDHVLEHISPHIGRSDEPDGDALGDYLRSLQAVRNLPARFVLPGHGRPIANLAARVDELEEHHQRRLEEVLRVLAEDEQTAYDIAGNLSWKRAQDGWQRLSLFERSSALDETCSHLDYLVKRQQVSRQLQDGVTVYQRSAKLPVDA